MKRPGQDQLTDAINASGFPLQIGVERALERRFGSAIVVGREMPWEADGRSGFIDLVLRASALRFVIECKRAKSSNWAFVVESRAPGLPIEGDPDFPLHTERFRSRWAIRDRGEKFGYQHSYGNLFVGPSSYESEFCQQYRENDPKPDRSSLDRVAEELVAATEALGLREEAILTQEFVMRWYLPMMVTTATLQAFLIDDSAISLEDGSAQGVGEIVPWIRYRKSLTTTPTATFDGTDIEAVRHDSERSVFIVNAARTVEFFERFSLPPGQGNPATPLVKGS